MMREPIGGASSVPPTKLCWCIHYCPHFCDVILDMSPFTRQRFPWTLSSRGQSPSWRGGHGGREGQEQEVITLCTQSGSRKQTRSRSGYQVSVPPTVIYFLQVDFTSQGFHSPPKQHHPWKSTWEHGRNFTFRPQQVGCGYHGFCTSRGLVHRGHLTNEIQTLTAGFVQTKVTNSLTCML